jgi:hypothetical protein
VVFHIPSNLMLTRAAAVVVTRYLLEHGEAQAE